jgi:hypothetical protein
MISPFWTFSKKFDVSTSLCLSEMIFCLGNRANIFLSIHPCDFYQKTMKFEWVVGMLRVATSQCFPSCSLRNSIIPDKMQRTTRKDIFSIVKLRLCWLKLISSNSSHRALSFDMLFISIRSDRRSFLVL